MPTLLLYGFVAITLVAFTSAGPSVMPYKGPFITDTSFKDVEHVIAGKLVMISYNVKNNLDTELPFVSIIELRDATGVTTDLFFHLGVLEPSAEIMVGSSWVPKYAGDYQIRNFEIAPSFQNPEFMSALTITEITVEDASDFEEMQ